MAIPGVRARPAWTALLVLFDEESALAYHAVHMVGKSFSHYRVLAKLGEGGMGVVYKAEDTRLKRTVALKFLPQMGISDQAKTRFVREAQAAAGLDHPNICTIHDIDEVEGRPFISMAYVEGQTLRERIESGLLKTEDALLIAVQTAKGLQAAHAKGIVHRDIKSSNIMVTPGGHVKITDFGLAKLEGQTGLTRAGTVMGTLAYMSPEQLRGEGVGHRTDIWSLGVVLYEMVTGRLPFRGNQEEAVMYAILYEDPAPVGSVRRDLPPELDRTVARALAKAPEARFQDINEMLADLQLLSAACGSWSSPDQPVPPGPEAAEKTLPFPFHTDAEELPEPERPVFVGREHELAKLFGFLDLALAGKGRVVFVSGEAGTGKTALTEEFTRRAQEMHSDVIVAGGKCNAHTGIGDPYLPFREILSLLTGDVEARWAAGTLTREHCTRLWNLLPLAVEAIVTVAPDLIDTFLHGSALMLRTQHLTSGYGASVARLKGIVDRKATTPPVPHAQQSNLFEQYTKVLRALSREATLVLVLDDLQWADAGSVSLLFHLGRGLVNSRILIVGTFRLAEVSLGRGEERHPLESVINEFRREFGDCEVELSQAEGRQFIGSYLDAVPNRLGAAFRDTLYRQTEGNPLFTVESLRGMQEQGMLIQDEEGCWIEGPALDWDALPARVDAVIEERIARLPESLKKVLAVACVEGEDFAAEVVARVQDSGDLEMVRLLSSELGKRHQLVMAQGVERVGSQRLSRYRFRHILFQRYLYSHLDPVERSHLHEEVATILEKLHSERGEEIAAQLARHFQEAGLAARAVEFLCQAGNRAVGMSANEEAIAHFKRGLELLDTIPETPQRSRQELALQLGLAIPVQAARGYGAPELGHAYTRAYELCEEIGEAPERFRVSWLLWTYRLARGEHRAALELGTENLELAHRARDPLQVALARWFLGANCCYLGDFVSCRAHMEHKIAFYDRKEHHSLAFIYGTDPGVGSRTWLSLALWALGYPDQALKWSEEAIALAQELNHPYSLALALGLAGCDLHASCRDIRAFRRYSSWLTELCGEHGFALIRAGAVCWEGYAQAEEGRLEEGLAQMQQGLDAYQETGAEMHRPRFLGWLAEAHGKLGQVEEALGLASEALAAVEKSDERQWEAELYRIRGELLLLQGEDDAEAEASFHQALGVARKQSARSWELRAGMSLGRLWQRQGKREEARELLSGIYNWFTEGYDTGDLKEARELLGELS